MTKLELKSASMPLINWLLILLAVFSIFVGFYFFSPELPTRRDVRFDSHVAAEWNRLNVEKTQVVILGTSLLRQGINMESRNLSASTQLLMFYQPAAMFLHLDKFVAVGMPVSPELFIIQTDLLVDRRKGFLSTFRKKSTKVMLHIGKLIKGNSPPPKNYKKLPRNPFCRGRNVSQVDATVRKFKKYYAQSRKRSHYYQEKLHALQKSGFSLVLIDMPRSPTIENRLQPELSLWRERLSIISQELDIPILHYPDEFKDSEYCDSSHMAKLARKVHEPWLKSKIREMLNDTSG